MPRRKQTHADKLLAAFNGSHPMDVATAVARWVHTPDCSPQARRLILDACHVDERVASLPGAAVFACRLCCGSGRIASDYRMLRNAGLGITGAGETQITCIEYKPGEVVDEARVLAAIKKMREEADRAGTDFEITCPKVLGIYPKKQSNDEQTIPKKPDANKKAGNRVSNFVQFCSSEFGRAPRRRSCGEYY